MNCKVHGVTKSRTQLSNFHFSFKRVPFSLSLTLCVCVCVCVCICVHTCLHAYSVMSDSCDPMGIAHWTPLAWNSPGKNTGASCHVLLQGIEVMSPASPALGSPCTHTHISVYCILNHG